MRVCVCVCVCSQCQIPFAKALCPTVDSELKQVVIDPPEGLLDNVTYKKMRVTDTHTHTHVHTHVQTHRPAIDKSWYVEQIVWCNLAGLGLTREKECVCMCVCVCVCVRAAPNA